MSFIRREAGRIRAAILDGSNREAELRAAQQALEWALEPRGIASPLAVIKGTQEGSGGCRACPDPRPS